MDTRPIGVFDSGLGGLTAVRELARVCRPGGALSDLPGGGLLFLCAGGAGAAPLADFWED